MDARTSPGFETLCIHFAEDRERNFGSAAPPLYQCSTFTYPDCDSFTTRADVERTRYDYTRLSNPTTELFERKMAEVEGGEAARAFSSGMAAISGAILSCVKTGDHVVCIETVYGPTRTFLSDYLPKFGIETTYVRGTQIDQFRRALRPNTRLIYVESPSSLLFELQDLAAVAELARSKGIATVCDGSNSTPYFQNPIRLGIDMVAHTATKYIGGHSDLVAGVVVGSRQRLASMVKLEGELLGGVCDPFVSWLMLRGLRTLAVRLDRHQSSATAIARMLESHPRVARVFYSGLESHPQAELARRQMRGHSGMLSFELRDGTHEGGGDGGREGGSPRQNGTGSEPSTPGAIRESLPRGACPVLPQAARRDSRHEGGREAGREGGRNGGDDDAREAAYRVVNALRYFCIAVSWGGYESLAIPLEVRDPVSGRSMWIIRLSVGLESVEDLKADLLAALKA